jgi:DNA topoisomerase-1
MRTDSTNLSSLALNTSKKYITEEFGPEYSHPRQYKTHSKGAQEAHEAIRPTFIENTQIEGSAQEQKLYNLIWKRTVASQMAEAKVENTEVVIDIDNRPEKFIINGTRVLFDGFLKLYSEGTDDAAEEEDSTILPEIKAGEQPLCNEIKAECKFTRPPFRYSEATLVKKLEELGIGRPSTYAPTISTLTTGRGYLVRGNKEGKKVQVTNLSLKGGKITESEKTEVIGEERGKLLPQEVGMQVTDYLVENFPRILDYNFTADVEKDFDQIAEGDKEWNKVIAAFYGPFHKEVEEDLNDGKFNHVERELGNDPATGEPIVARYGKYGAFVQKGSGDDKQYASLLAGQLIETITLAEALKLFELPRIVGKWNGFDVVATRGRFGPYLKWNDKNYSLPKSKDPLKITIEECGALIEEQNSKPAAGAVLVEYKDSDIQVINGRYGPYIKHAGNNYRIPKGTDAAALSEEACKKIIEESKPTAKKNKFNKRYTKKS